MFVRREFAIAMVFGLAVLGSGAVGSASSVPETADPGGDSTASAADLDRDATLTYAWSSPNGSWDPARTRNPFQDQIYLSMVYDRLVQLSPDGKIVPQLSTGWELSDDQMTLTFSIRDDVVFQDGTPVDAQAIADSVNRQRTLEGSLYIASLSTVSSVDAPDATTVAVTLTEPDPTILYDLATMAGAVVNPSAIADDSNLELEPAGSGPYRLVSAGQDRIVFERNEDYFDPDVAKLARIEVLPIIDTTARLNAVRSGQADIGQFAGEQYAEVQSLVDSGEFALATYQTTNDAPIYLNSAVPPLDDPQVRLALNLAVDRESINQNIFQGQCPAAGQVLPEGFVGYDPDIADYEFDPDRARELLAEAGVESITIDALTTASEPYNTIGQIVADMWSEIGLTVNYETLEPAAIRGTFREGVAAAASQAMSVASPDPSAVMEALILGPDNPGGAVPDETFAADAATAKALPLGSDERAEAYQDLNARATATPNHVRICHLPNFYLHTTQVVGADQFAYASLSPIAEPQRLGKLAG